MGVPYNNKSGINGLNVKAEQISSTFFDPSDFAPFSATLPHTVNISYFIRYASWFWLLLSCVCTYLSNLANFKALLVVYGQLKSSVSKFTSCHAAAFHFKPCALCTKKTDPHWLSHTGSLTQLQKLCRNRFTDTGPSASYYCNFMVEQALSENTARRHTCFFTRRPLLGVLRQ